MTKTATNWDVFVGTDTEGDACLYITVGPQDGPNEFLTHKQLEALAPAIQELLATEKLTVIEAEPEEDEDEDEDDEEYFCTCCDGPLDDSGEGFGDLCPGCADKVSEYQDATGADEDRAIAFIQDNPDWDGSLQCHTCGTQCDQDGICPACKVMEEAGALLHAVMGRLPMLTGPDIDANIKAWNDAYKARLAELTPEEEERRQVALAAIDVACAQSIQSCRKCGKALTLEDVEHGDACADTGEGEEAGKVFVYCSAHCRETH